MPPDVLYWAEASDPQSVAKDCGLKPDFYRKLELELEEEHVPDHPILRHLYHLDDRELRKRDFDPANLPKTIAVSRGFLKGRRARQLQAAGIQLIKIVSSTDSKRLARSPRKDEVFQTDDMITFSKGTTRKAIAARIKKRHPRRSKNSVGYTFPLYYLTKYRKYRWLVDHVERGKDLPAHVTLVSAEHYKRCHHAWDYRGLLRSLGGLRTHLGKPSEEMQPTCYSTFLLSFPSDGDLFEWVWWQFGGPEPQRWFIIDETLMDLRRERSVEGICERDAADVDKTTVYGWRSDETQKQALQDAINWAEGCKEGKEGPPPKSTAWQKLFGNLDALRGDERSNRERMREAMLRFARHATWRACWKRAGTSKAAYKGKLKKAATVGSDVKENLKKYVDAGFRLFNDDSDDSSLEIFDEQRHNKCGIIASQLYLPSPSQLPFRDAAIERRNQSGEEINKVRENLRRRMGLEDNEPDTAFQEWFLDWTIPKPLRKELDQRRAELAREQDAQRQAAEQEKEAQRQAAADDAKDNHGDPEQGEKSELDGYVLVSKLYPQHFSTYKRCRTFLKNHPEINTKKPRNNRLYVNAADWANHWAKERNRAFESVDAPHDAEDTYYWKTQREGDPKTDGQ